MGEQWTTAIYGATGALGRELRVGLEGHDAPIARLVPVAGVRTAGEVVPWRGARNPVISAREVDLAGVDLAIVAVPAAVAATEIARLRERGVLVIDLSGARRTGPGEPLPVVWPEIGADALDEHPGGFALPGAAASTLAPVLHALAGAGFTPREVDVVELATAGDYGREGPEALSKQTVGLLSYSVFDAAPFREPLAFNVLDGATGDQAREARFVDEMQALLPTIPARYRLSTLLVPAFAGVAVQCTLRGDGTPPDPAALTAALEAHPDVELIAPGTALRDAMDADAVHVSPPRVDADGAVRVVAMADPLHRLGDRAARLVKRVLEEELW